MSPTDSANSMGDDASPFRPAMATESEQYAFLRQILDINPNLIFAKDREGRFTLVNQAVADVYGTTVEALIGKTDADFNPNKEEVAFFRQMDLEVMNSLKEHVIPEEKITDAAGNVHFLQTVKRPIIGPNGVANHVLGVATDITERKRLEEQLRESQKMEALGFLAGGIAHDFNNLLTVIFGNADLMAQRLKSRQRRDERLVSCLELILAAARRGESLTRQLLAFGRRQPLHPVVLDMNAVIRDAADLLKRLLGEQNVLEIRLEERPLYVKVDPGQLEQILMNLAVNARDAMPAGGVLRIATCVRELDRAHVANHPQAQVGRHGMLSVSDTGTGIAPEILGKIFDPFFTTKPVGQGTGLGLSTVYGIVKQAGGHVAVESTVGKGTTFRIFLPLVAAPFTAAGETAGNSMSAKGKETVLVCEDQRDVLDLAADILRLSGYEVLAAQSPRRAIEVAEEHCGPIHLLLTDIVMPEMNGVQLAAAIRERRPGTKVLFMSGYASEMSGNEGDAALGRLLPKPFGSRVLLDEVRATLDRREPDGFGTDSV